MNAELRFSIGASLIVVAAILAYGLTGVPDWLGWLLLLPALLVLGSAIRRGVLEPLAIALLVVGGVMNCQPHVPLLFRASTAVLLVAVLLFTIATHRRADGRELTSAGRRVQATAAAALALGGAAALQPWWPALALPGAALLGLGVAATVAAALLARASIVPPVDQRTPA